jgi:hypothetical protein
MVVDLDFYVTFRLLLPALPTVPRRKWAPVRSGPLAAPLWPGLCQDVNVVALFPVALLLSAFTSRINNAVPLVPLVEI